MALNEAQKKERSEYLEKYLQITECSQRKPYIFISYASDNWETVFKNAVVPMQKQFGLRVYADKAFDKVNDKWIVPMLRNIRGADAVVAFVSQSYIESYACFLELLTAVNNRKQIIFVSLEESLHLGDTTDQPVVERGAKNEILNQGANISTNTNNTSNDIMRAMKSAYTSISTLLEQDALSKYDISDAFINFFRDASINRKTINDLRAVRGTISSVSKRVFDKSLVTESPKPAQPVQPPRPEPAYQPPVQPPVEPPVQPAQAEPAYQPPVQTEPVYQPPEAAEAEPAYQPQPEPVYQPPVQTQAESAYQPPEAAKTAEPQDFTWTEGEKGKKKSSKKLLIGGGAAAVVVVLLLALVLGGGKSVENQPITLLDGSAGVYTGKWKDDQPADGEGTITWNDTGNTYEGEFKDGNPNGQGICTYSTGASYTGGWATNTTMSAPDGQGTLTEANGNVSEGIWDSTAGHMTQGKMTTANGDVYDGEWNVNNGYFLKGKATYANGNVFDGDWDVNTGYFLKGTATYANGDIYTGEWGNDDGSFSNGTIKFTNGDVYEGSCRDGYFNGQGTLTHADGTVESGEWASGMLSQTLQLSDGTYTGAVSNGKPNGSGTMEYTNGQVYVGDWVNGKREGNGRCTESDGGYYDGEWKNDKYNGQGTAYYGGDENSPDADFYVGEFADGFRDGYGVYTWSNGDRYEGNYAKGRRHGQGKITYANAGENECVTREGEWLWGEMDGVQTLTYGNGAILYEKYNNGTLIEIRDKDGNLIKS